jgi:hypothetical protein
MIPAAMNDLVGFLTENCCGGRADCGPTCIPAAVPASAALRDRHFQKGKTMNDVRNVLFLCTGNGARSMAQSLMDHHGGGLFAHRL